MKGTLLLMISIIFSGLTFSQVRFTAQSKRLVRVGETFQLEFSVNSNASGFRAPRISGFDIISGPNSSTSSSYSSINGKVTNTITNTYSYYLRARRAGKFTVPAAQITVKGKTYKSNSISIEVVAGENGNTPGNQQTGVAGEDLFVRINLSKTNVYQGEYIIATAKIYTRVDLVNFEDITFPPFTGFWNQDIKTSSNISLKREKVNGKIYDVGLLKQNILYAQKQGKLTVEPLKIKLVVRQKNGKGRDFFGRIVDRYENVRKVIQSLPVTVTVKPLPGNKPDNFSGIVGSNFKISGSISKNKINVNDGINLKLKLSGSGNLSLINELDIDLPSGFQVYPPTIKENIQNTTGGTSGYKAFDYFMQALEPGEYTIKPIEFCYFDVKSKRYKTIKTDEFKVSVEGVAGENGNQNGTVYNPQVEVENQNSDIRYIKQNNLKLYEKNKHFVDSNIFYASYVAGLLLFFFIIFIKIKIKK